MSKVNYQLITVAREIEGYTQKEFAQAIGIEQGTLSKIENGLVEKISSDVIEKIAFVVDYPVDFFYNEWNPIRVEGHYRRKVSESVKLFKENRAKMTLAEYHLNVLTEHIEIPASNYPTWDLTEDGSVELCAKHVREFWKVPKGKIENLTEILERNGFVIIELDLGEMSGFSCFSTSGIPIIFVNRNMPGDRYRLTLAHEAFHFILHHGQKVSPDRDVEKEAYAAASEFLVPIDEISNHFNRLTLSKLMDLKAYWKMSMSALLTKASKSGYLTIDQSKYLNKQLSAAGYRKKEPIDIAKEEPQIIKEVINAHLVDFKYSIEELNKLLHFNKVEEWYLNKKPRLKILKRMA